MFWGVLLIVVCWSSSGLRAQPTTPPDSVSAATSEGATAAENAPQASENPSPLKLLDRLPTQSLWLPNSEGVLVEVLPGATLEKFQKFLQEQFAKPEVKLPPAVTKLTLTGKADDVRAVLVADLEIQNEHADGEFVLVPLALHEAVLRDDWTYEGPGTLLPKEPDRTQGQTWWLRGKGRHRLTLKLSVPVKKQGANRRLHLTLPFASLSKLNLTTNFPHVVVKESEGDIDVIPVEGQSARIEKIGLGARLDLTWQPVVAESPLAPVLEADTDILVHAAQEELLIEAQQRINVVQGSVSEVVVRLPGSARLINVAGSRDYRSYRVSPEDAQRVVIQLNGPTSGPFQLTWTARLKSNPLRKFELDGFLVEQARRQDGRIGLIPIEGLRMTVANADHPYVSQINAADLRSPSGRVSRAYRFFNQPFRLVLGVETVEPSFTVEPRVTLNVSAEELSLEGLFTLHVLRGDLKTVEIDWPNWKTDGWILAERPDDLLEDNPAGPERNAGRLRLRLSDDHPDRLAVRIQARRAVRPGENIPVSLPHIASPDGAQTHLVLSDAANISSDLTPIGETASFSLPVESSDGSKESLPAAAQRARAYRVLPGEQAFSLRVTRLEQRVQVSSITTLAFNGMQLRGTQSFQFDVQHERMAQVRLAIPEAWRSRPLQFQLDPARSLTVEWVKGASEGVVVAQLTLPEPRLGQFTIQAVWTLPLSGEALQGETGIEIPVFQVADHALRQTELHVDAEDAEKLTVTDPAWKPRAEVSGRARWTADSPVTAATIQLETDGGTAQPFLITGADLRANFDRQGMAHCEATYRLTGWLSRIGLVMPADAGPPQAIWNGRPLVAPQEIQAENKPRHYTVRVQADPVERQEHLLTVRYTLPASQAFGVWNRWTITAPQLAQGQWMAEGNWLLHVPSDQHLFGFSSLVTPQFSWERTGMFWSRISRPAGRVSRASPTGMAAGEPGGNFYAFSQFGEIHEFRFSTMSAPMVLLIGASVSLMIAFLVLNLAWMRHLLTLWCGVFLLALAGLWFRPQLEVLLQPILIGCLFPLFAVWIQSLRRRDVPPVLSFDPLMDLVESRSSVSRPPYPGDEFQQDPVLARAPTGSTHDFLQAEARSGLP